MQCSKSFVSIYINTSFEGVPSACPRNTTLRAAGPYGQRLGPKSLSPLKNDTSETYLLSLKFLLSRLLIIFFGCVRYKFLCYVILNILLK